MTLGLSQWWPSMLYTPCRPQHISSKANINKLKYYTKKFSQEHMRKNLEKLMVSTILDFCLQYMSVRFCKHLIHIIIKDNNIRLWAYYGTVSYSLICIKPTRFAEAVHVNGLVQERRNSGALAVELHLSCTNPPIYHTSKSQKTSHMLPKHVGYGAMSTLKEIDRVTMRPSCTSFITVSVPSPEQSGQFRSKTLLLLTWQ